MNKRLIILFAIFIVVPAVIGLVILLSSGGNEETPDPSDQSTQTDVEGAIGTLKINGLSDHRNDIDSVSALNIEKVLHRYLGDDGKSYTGSIREGSYTKQPVNNLYLVRFLVDVESAQQTYVVFFSGPSNLVKYSPIDIECPEENEIRYPDANCKIEI